MLNRVSKWREERKKRQAIQELHDTLLHLKNRKDILGEDVEAEIEGVYKEFDKYWDPPDPIHKIGGRGEMSEERMVFWKVRKLAKEFNMTPWKVGGILRALGAKKWGNSAGNKCYYWGEND